MTAPHRRPQHGPTRRRAAAGPSARSTRATRATGATRPTPLGATAPVHRLPDAWPHALGPHAAEPTGATGLTAGVVVAPGDRVGLDDSASVRGLLPEIVGARPSLVGTSSLDTLVLLSACTSELDGAVRVRLFGGHHHVGGAFVGARTLHAVTDTECDVALVSARIVGDEVRVPGHARDARLGLLLAAGRAYLVPDEAPDDDTAPRWVRLAAVADFAGVVAPPRTGAAARTRAA